MDMDNLAKILQTIKRSAFRLETLATYRSPGETEPVRMFREGEAMPPRNPGTDPWLGMVADSVRAGRTWSRVHVLTRPLSEYLQFELLGYEGNVTAGEDVRIADRDACPRRLASLTQDFWLLDGEIAVVMRYDEEGRCIGMERNDDVAAFMEHRDLALAHSIPLAEFLASVRDELPRSW